MSPFDSRALRLAPRISLTWHEQIYKRAQLRQLLPHCAPLRTSHVQQQRLQVDSCTGVFRVSGDGGLTLRGRHGSQSEQTGTFNFDERELALQQPHANDSRFSWAVLRRLLSLSRWAIRACTIC